jgi:hypothetical protein
MAKDKSHTSKEREAPVHHEKAPDHARPEEKIGDGEPKAAPQPPSLGRIVIYTSAGEKGLVGEQHAAVITAVEGDTVSLRAWTRTTDYVVLAVRFTDCAPGSVEAQGRWTWPPRI